MVYACPVICLMEWSVSFDELEGKHGLTLGVMTVFLSECFIVQPSRRLQHNMRLASFWHYYSNINDATSLTSSRSKKDQSTIICLLFNGFEGTVHSVSSLRRKVRFTASEVQRLAHTIVCLCLSVCLSVSLSLTHTHTHTIICINT